MSAIKRQVCFVDCSFIYADLRRLFVFTMFEFLRQKFGAAEKSQGAAVKNKEKVDANCTGFSAVLWFSVS